MVQAVTVLCIAITGLIVTILNRRMAEVYFVFYIDGLPMRLASLQCKINDRTLLKEGYDRLKKEAEGKISKLESFFFYTRILLFIQKALSVISFLICVNAVVKYLLQSAEFPRNLMYPVVSVNTAALIVSVILFYSIKRTIGEENESA